MSLSIALQQIEFARGYMLSLLADIDEADWFRQPAGCPTHIAWQIGHLAMAEYGLCLYRQRGRESIDREIMPGDFRKQFSRGTMPDPDPAKHLPPAEIRVTLDRVHPKSFSNPLPSRPSSSKNPSTCPTPSNPPSSAPSFSAPTTK